MIDRLLPALLGLAFVAPAFGQTNPVAPESQPAPAAPAATATPSATATPKEAAAASGYSENTSAAASKLGYSSVRVSEPWVALTFDDGPHPTLTPKLLDILKARKAKATFYVLGELATQHPEILKRAVAEGHEIGNHSWSHPNLAKMGEDAVRSQLQRTQEAVTRATGISPKTVRPPYGSITERERHLLTETLGFKIIMWSVDPLDWKNRDSGIVSRRILAQAAPGSIILAHDIHATTVDAMPNVIDSLAAKGFKFATVSELIAMEHPSASPKPAAEPKADAPANAKPKKPKKRN